MCPHSTNIAGWHRSGSHLLLRKAADVHYWHAPVARQATAHVPMTVVTASISSSKRLSPQAHLCHQHPGAVASAHEVGNRALRVTRNKSIADALARSASAPEAATRAWRTHIPPRVVKPPVLCFAHCASRPNTRCAVAASTAYTPTHAASPCGFPAENHRSGRAGRAL